LIADLNGQLQTADPLFHLTNGFFDRVVQLPAGSRVDEMAIDKSDLMNPRRYGAMTSEDYARAKLSVFAREEAGAIVSYVEWKWEQGDKSYRDEIDAALDGFWRQRAREAPTQVSLRQHIQAEAQYMKDLRET
jgi:hypothetical protein